MSNGDSDQEQEYISMLYGRLDDLRDRASGRLSKVLLETGGTPAARSERDAFVEMYSQRITQLDAAENGLCFGRLDLAEGDRRYIGRIGILDDASDYEALLVDWRAPAARPFYIATAFSPEGVLRRRHIRTRQRKVTGVDDEVLDIGPDGAGWPAACGRARRADRRSGPDRGAVRHPDGPDGRHRGNHPGRAGPDHPVAAQRA